MCLMSTEHCTKFSTGHETLKVFVLITELCNMQLHPSLNQWPFEKVTRMMTLQTELLVWHDIVISGCQIMKSLMTLFYTI